MKKERIYQRLDQIEELIQSINEKLYNPNIENSEYRELSKKRKKLTKDVTKLKRRLEAVNE
jgi:hypothetical protein